MKTIQITINENDMYGVEGDCIDIGKFCDNVESILSNYKIEWTINKNTSGVCPEPTIDYEEPTQSEYLEIRDAQENAFQNPDNWV